MACGYNGPSKLSSPVLRVLGVTGVQNTSQGHSPREKCPGYVPSCCVKLRRLNLICAWRRLEQQFLSLTEEVISVGGNVHPFNILTLGRDIWKHRSVKKEKVPPLFLKRGSCFSLAAKSLPHTKGFEPCATPTTGRTVSAGH